MNGRNRRFYRYKNQKEYSSQSQPQSQPSVISDGDKKWLRGEFGESWFRKLLLYFLELIVIIGFLAFFFERREVTETRIYTAWQILNMKAPGNSGKAHALTYLNSWQCYYLDVLIPEFDEYWISGFYNGNYVIEDGPSPRQIALVRWLQDFVCLKRPVSFQGIDLTTDEVKEYVDSDYDINDTTKPNTPVKTYLHNANLALADLRDAKLQNTDFANADFYRASLSRADLRHAHFEKANLTGANIDFAKAHRARFSEADLRCASLSGDFSEASFFLAHLDGSRLDGSDFSDADFRGAHLSGANMSNVTLDGAVVTEAILYGVKGLDCETLQTAQLWERTYRDEKLRCGKEIPVQRIDE
ncbi:TPA: pentapeptide repeat-containing protein [Vibrio parahaemolyticus]|nr:pentapeptide repeat-containing protein [Vibrio parahaemolyticus]